MHKFLFYAKSNSEFDLFVVDLLDIGQKENSQLLFLHYELLYFHILSFLSVPPGMMSWK